MIVKKTDVLISFEEPVYKVYVRKKLFWFIYSWIPVTHQETEMSEELPIAFNTIDEAREFTNLITE